MIDKAQDTQASGAHGNDSLMLEKLQRHTFDYFLRQTSAPTGLIADSTQPGAPASIAATGMGLTCYTVAVEKGILSRAEAVQKTLKILRFFAASVQSNEATATGYKGFYYHLLDMKSGRRLPHTELSTIDTGFFIAGCLTAGQYFSGAGGDEAEVRQLADKLYQRVDWRWALNGGSTLSHGWKPDSGFLAGRWDNKYCEAILMYVLAMGSPTHAITAQGYLEWTATFEFRKLYGIEYIYAAPLFIHQFSQIWLDFSGIRDEVNRKHNLDYFENSRRATLAQQAYAVSNPLSYDYYGENCWGFTASDGPGEKTLEVDGVKRVFHGYKARGAPEGLDDGTVSPWAATASLPFASRVVIEAVRNSIEKIKRNDLVPDGLEASFNFCYPEKSGDSAGWVAPWRLGINQGPVVLMIENFFSGLVWKTFRKCPHVIQGLKTAGFKGGWLDH